jgi:hypothetical protein
MSNTAPFITGDINNGNPLVLFKETDYPNIVKLTDFVFNPSYDADNDSKDISGNYLTFGPVDNDHASGNSLHKQYNDFAEYFAEYDIENTDFDNLYSAIDKENYIKNNMSKLGTFSKNKFFDLDIISGGDTLLYEVFIDDTELTETGFDNITFNRGVLSVNLSGDLSGVNSLNVGTYSLKFKVTDLDGETAEQSLDLHIIDESNSITVYDGWNLIGAPFDCELYKESEVNASTSYNYDPPDTRKYVQGITEALYSYSDGDYDEVIVSSNKYVLTANTGYWIKVNLGNETPTRLAFRETTSTSLETSEIVRSSDVETTTENRTVKRVSSLEGKVSKLEKELSEMKKHLELINNRYIEDQTKQIIIQKPSGMRFTFGSKR